MIRSRDALTAVSRNVIVKIRVTQMKRPATVKVVSYAKLQHRYGNKFIAREDGKVLASGATYPALLKAIRERALNRKALIIGYVPPKDAICIYDDELQRRLKIAARELGTSPAEPMRAFAKKHHLT